ncbi:MAG: hypothetical protein OHK0022_59410 [Roseiflexaceae bacterium]
MTLASSNCPACNAPFSPNESICTVCGLVFASQIPAVASAAPVASTAPLPPLAAPPAAPVPLYPGQRLAQGRYSVLRLISRGGMGAVALASDADAFGRTVVVKAMLDYYDPTRPDDAQEARERFVHEARTLAELRHPAIPQIYAYFQDGAQNYIVMEYVEGHDLEQGLTVRDERGVVQPGQPYPREQVLRLGVSVCRILEYLAGRKPDPVVHHDIKPANLLLDRNSGDVRLVDFGTARKRPAVGGGRAEPGFGTPGYAPPEQYRGQSEPRSDVYALAATLYHLATDDDPRDHPFSFPRLEALDDLGLLLQSALDRDVSRRPGATELRGALEVLLRPEGPPPIEAPDGTPLTGTVGLVAWCEQHWGTAANWMARSLPQQIELRWGQTRLAHQLHELFRRQPQDQDAALDAALALLDPQGFGRQSVQISYDPPSLDFGTLRRDRLVQRNLTIRNSGRRHAVIQLKLPAWIVAPKLTLALHPGERIQVELSAQPGSGMGPRLQDSIAIQGTHRLGLIPVAAEMPLDVRIMQWLAQAAGGVNKRKIVLAVVAAGLALRWVPSLGLWTPAPSAMAPPYSGMPMAVVDADSRDQPPYGSMSPTPQQFNPAGNGTAVASSAAAPALSDQLSALSDGPSLGLSVDPRGQRYTRVEGNIVNLYQVNNNRLLLRVAEHQGPVRDAAFSPDGKMIASISEDRLLRVANVNDGSFQNITLTYQPQRLAWRPDSAALAVADGSSIHIVSLIDSQELATIRLQSRVTDMHWRSDGQLLSIAGDPRAVVIWDAIAKTQWSIPFAGLSWLPPAFSGNGRWVAQHRGASWDVYRLPEGQLDATIEAPARLRSFALSSDGRWLAALQNGGLEIWNVQQEKIATQIQAGDAVRVLFSPDDNLILIGPDASVTVLANPVR